MYNESADNSQQESFDSDEEFSMKINYDENEVHEVAKRWYTLADEDEKLCISGITTYKWIDDGSITSTNQLLHSCGNNLKTILKKDAIIENRERKLKVTTSSLQSI